MVLGWAVVVVVVLLLSTEERLRFALTDSDCVVSSLPFFRFLQWAWRGEFASSSFDELDPDSE